jgi:hypothetical protein
MPTPKRINRERQSSVSSEDESTQLFATAKVARSLLLSAEKGLVSKREGQDRRKAAYHPAQSAGACFTEECATPVSGSSFKSPPRLSIKRFMARIQRRAGKNRRGEEQEL